MRRPESRVVLMSVMLVGVGSFAGAFLDRLSFPHVARIFTTCASSKQFIVEFRVMDGREKPPGLIGTPFSYATATLYVDGTHIGRIEYNVSLRHFLCEGNHRAKLIFHESQDSLQEHVIDFAVSRPSLFHLTEDYLAMNETGTCVSETCINRKLFLELSPYEPDDVKARIFPKEAGR